MMKSEERELIRKTSVCPECGSRDLEVTSSMPGENEGFIGSQLRKLKDLLIPSGPLAGTWFVRCRSCGHVTSIMK